MLSTQSVLNPIPIQQDKEAARQKWLEELAAQQRELQDRKRKEAAERRQVQMVYSTMFEAKPPVAPGFQSGSNAEGEFTFGRRPMHAIQMQQQEEQQHSLHALPQPPSNSKPQPREASKGNTEPTAPNDFFWSNRTHMGGGEPLRDAQGNLTSLRGHLQPTPVPPPTTNSPTPSLPTKYAPLPSIPPANSLTPIPLNTTGPLHPRPHAPQPPSPATAQRRAQALANAEFLKMQIEEKKRREEEERKEAEREDKRWGWSGEVGKKDDGTREGKVDGVGAGDEKEQKSRDKGDEKEKKKVTDDRKDRSVERGTKKNEAKEDKRGVRGREQHETPETRSDEGKRGAGGDSEHAAHASKPNPQGHMHSKIPVLRNRKPPPQTKSGSLSTTTNNDWRIRPPIPPVGPKPNMRGSARRMRFRRGGGGRYDGEKENDKQFIPKRGSHPPAPVHNIAFGRSITEGKAAAVRPPTTGRRMWPAGSRRGNEGGERLRRREESKVDGQDGRGRNSTSPVMHNETMEVTQSSRTAHNKPPKPPPQQHQHPHPPFHQPASKNPAPLPPNPFPHQHEPQPRPPLHQPHTQPNPHQHLEPVTPHPPPSHAFSPHPPASQTPHPPPQPKPPPPNLRTAALSHLLAFRNVLDEEQRRVVAEMGKE
ncbi:hypothetical protein HDV00_003670 [Rhizophlyctis rosea]|nr:hypothetical protein HDV00_003670 [Rhizophlyctis rosea]